MQTYSIYELCKVSEIEIIKTKDATYFSVTKVLEYRPNLA